MNQNEYNASDHIDVRILWEQCLPKINNIKGKVILTSIPIGDNYFHELYLNNMQQRTKLDDILDRMPLLRKKYEEWDATVHTVVKSLEYGSDPLNIIQQLVINNIELSDRYKQFVDDVNHLTIYRQRYE